MEKRTFSEEQVAGIVREGPSGMAVQALCAKHNISEPTYYKWKKKHGDIDVSHFGGQVKGDAGWQGTAA